jgi:hypothetical protein
MNTGTEFFNEDIDSSQNRINIPSVSLNNTNRSNFSGVHILD